jgi:hypothetical protein
VAWVATGGDETMQRKYVQGHILVDG